MSETSSASMIWFMIFFWLSDLAELDIPMVHTLMM